MNLAALNAKIVSDTEAPHELYRSKLFPGSSHTWAITKLSKIQPNSKILDFGSGSGIMGQELQSLGFKSIYGVEINSAACEATKQFYTTLVTSRDQLPDTKFDVILLLDVIEHLAKPEELLCQLLPHINKGGKILLSVPNIAHWSVRILLLLGFFGEMDRGPLDKTHLRFFTVKILRSFLSKFPQFKPKSISASIVPLELMLPPFMWNNSAFSLFSKLRMTLANIWPAFFGYQLMVEIEVP